MTAFGRVMTCFALGVLIQGGIYLYLDKIHFAPTTDFEVTGLAEAATDDRFPQVTDATAYYSHDREYMAAVRSDSVKIYQANEPTPTVIDLKGRSVSFFEWMPDRALSVMGLYGGDEDRVFMARLDPADVKHEVDTELEDLPGGSRITDAVYSTATNVVYMKVRVDENAYRIYRTDANYDTRRVYMQASNIGRIAVFYDEDVFFYDNVRTGDVYMFNGTEGGWRVINPSGRYRLIGIDGDKNIFIAHVNADNEALAVLRGRLGVGFTEEYKYDRPTTLSPITVTEAARLIAEGNKPSDDKEKTKR